MNDGLYQAVYGGTCAGFVIEGGKVVRCAPILRKKIEFWKSIAMPISNVTADELFAGVIPHIVEDLLMALRFAYYVKASPLVPDALYDQAEKEFLARPEIKDSSLMQPGSDRLDDYPARIHALWLYLAVKREEDRPPATPAAAQNAPPRPFKPSKGVKGAEKAPEPATGFLF